MRTTRELSVQILTALAVTLWPAAAGATTYVSGPITSSVTWTLSGSPYVIQPWSVTVASGATLTIEPGVIVKFAAAGGSDQLYVSGVLNAVGSPTQHITFTSIQDDAIGGDTGGDGPTQGAPGQWASVYVAWAGSATFANTDVRYGGIYISNRGAGTLDFTSVRYGNGLTVDPCAAATVTRSDFSYNATGIYLSQNGGCPAQAVTIKEGTTVTYNSNTGIRTNVLSNYTGPAIAVTNVDVLNNGQYGVDLQVDPATPVGSQPYGHSNNIYNNGNGADMRQVNAGTHLPNADWTSNYLGPVLEAVACPWAPANTFPTHLSYEQPNPYTAPPKKGPVAYQTYARQNGDHLEYCAADKVKDYPYSDQPFNNAVFLQPPTLTLFLDEDNNFNPASPTDDSPTFVPGSPGGYSTLLPQPLSVYAAYVDARGTIFSPPSTANASFDLSNVSALKGIAMNTANPAGRNDDAPDFEATSPTSVAFDSNKVARLNLNCWDYGGSAVVTVTHAGATAHLNLPKDLDGNGVPDTGWWASGFGLDQHVPDLGELPSDDDDGTPAVTGPPDTGQIGDGFTRFEEYRGFMVQGSHIRTDPRVKDIFASSNVTWTDPADPDPSNEYKIGIQYAFPNLPALIHRVLDEHESGLPEYDPFGWVVNAKSTNAGYPGSMPGAANHIDQRALRVWKNAITYEQFLGFTWPIPGSCNHGGYTPREVLNIDIDVQKVQDYGTQQGDTATEIVNALRWLVGHEIGHGVHISHRPYEAECGEGDGAPVGSDESIMNTGQWYTPGLSDPVANYNSFDTAQIRLIIRP